MVRLSSTLLAIAATLGASAVFASPMAASQAEQQDLAVRREAALARLTPGVRAYLETLDPRDYTLDLDEEDEFEKRATAKAITQCSSGFATTYDDGPYQWHSELASKYAAAGHKLTFFLNGNNYDCAYGKSEVSMVRKSLAAGHQIASHTWSHVDLALSGLTDEQLETQVDLVETYMLKTLGIVPKYIRPPYGSYNQTILDLLVNKYKYRVITWNVDSGDGDSYTAAQSEAVYKTLKASQKNIILNHETHDTSVHEVADYAIKRYKKLGIKSQTVHSCLGKSGSAYKVQTKVQKRDDTWTCDGTPGPGQVEASK